MTRDEIIRIAKEASVPMPIDEWIADFANLVAAAEREASAKVLEKISTAPDMQAYAAAIRARGQG